MFLAILYIIQGIVFKLLSVSIDVNNCKKFIAVLYRLNLYFEVNISNSY